MCLYFFVLVLEERLSFWGRGHQDMCGDPDRAETLCVGGAGGGALALLGGRAVAFRWFLQGSTWLCGLLIQREEYASCPLPRPSPRPGMCPNTARAGAGHMEDFQGVWSRGHCPWSLPGHFPLTMSAQRALTRTRMLPWTQHHGNSAPSSHTWTTSDPEDMPCVSTGCTLAGSLVQYPVRAHTQINQ